MRVIVKGERDRIEVLLDYCKTCWKNNTMLLPRYQGFQSMLPINASRYLGFRYSTFAFSWLNPLCHAYMHTPRHASTSSAPARSHTWSI